MHQVVPHASKPHSRAGFRSKKLLEQSQGPQNYMISQSNMQARGWMLSFCLSPTTDMLLSFPLINLRYNIEWLGIAQHEFFSL